MIILSITSVTGVKLADRGSGVGLLNGGAAIDAYK